MGIMRFFGLGDSSTESSSAEETILEGTGDAQSEVVPVITMGSEIERQKRRAHSAHLKEPVAQVYPPDVPLHPMDGVSPLKETLPPSGLSAVKVGPVDSLKEFQPIDLPNNPPKDHATYWLEMNGRFKRGSVQTSPHAFAPSGSQETEHQQETASGLHAATPSNTSNMAVVASAPSADGPEDEVAATAPHTDLNSDTVPQHSSGGTDLSELRHRVLLASIQAPAPAKHLPELPPDVRPSTPQPVAPIEVMPSMRQPTMPVSTPPEEVAIPPETQHGPPPVSERGFVAPESSMPVAPSQPPPPPPTPLPPPLRPTLSTIRTFATDVTSTMADKQVSVVRAIAAEERRRQEMARVGYEPAREASSRARLYYLLGISSMLLVVGCAVLVYLFVFHETPLEVAVEFAATGYFTPDEKENVDITGKNRSDIIEKLTTSRDQIKVRMGGITQLVLTTTTVTSGGEPIVSVATSKDVLNMLGARVPNELAQTLSGPPMIGVYEGGSNTLFIVLTVRDFNTAFDAMLKWESRLISDVGQLFGRNPGTITVVSDTSRAHVPLESESSTTTSIGATSTGAVASTSPATLSEKPSDLTYKYAGRIIANKETRVLENTDDRSVALIWSFVDKTHLIIAPNESTFVEIQRRLVNAQ